MSAMIMAIGIASIVSPATLATMLGIEHIEDVGAIHESPAMVALLAL